MYNIYIYFYYIYVRVVKTSRASPNKENRLGERGSCTLVDSQGSFTISDPVVETAGFVEQQTFPGSSPSGESSFRDSIRELAKAQLRGPIHEKSGPQSEYIFYFTNISFDTRHFFFYVFFSIFFSFNHIFILFK